MKSNSKHRIYVYSYLPCKVTQEFLFKEKVTVSQAASLIVAVFLHAGKTCGCMASVT